MKTWQIALIGVGVVATVAIIAKVASAPASPELVYNNNPPTNGGPTGNVGERVASGSFSLAERLADGIFSKVARDDAARERQRERDAQANEKGSDSSDPNYDSAADYRRKTGGA